MYDYDGALKALFRSPANSIARYFAHSKPKHWFSGELSNMRKLEADLLCELANGQLLHIELQSRNDPSMPLRMAEYSLLIYKTHRRFPLQMVFYAGPAKLNMPNRLAGPNHHCEFTIVDMSQLDGQAWLESRSLSDNVLSILMKIDDQRAAIRQILRKITKADRPTKEAALAQLLILSELRSLAPVVSEEVSQMPITEDIMEHSIIGPAIRKGLAQGLRQGLLKGRAKGLEAGLEAGREEGLERGLEKGIRSERERMLCRLIQRRFGSISAEAKKILTHASNDDLARFADHILDAPTVEALFQSRKLSTTPTKRKALRSR